jgi:HlyD family secretion protein
MQHTRAAYLTRSNTASPQRLDQAVNDVAAARADVAAAEANHAAAQAGPRAEHHAIADANANAQVQAAVARLAVLERPLDTPPSRSIRPPSARISGRVVGCA